MSYEDEEFFVEGPLPDPSDRHWRHPSELGGLVAQPTDSPPLRSVGHGPLLVGAFALGGVAATLLAFSFGGALLFGQGQLGVSGADDFATVAGLTSATTALNPGSEHGSDSTDNGDEPAAADAGSAAEDDAETLALPSPGSTTPAGELESFGQDDSGQAVETQQLLTGVFASDDPDQRVASFLIHDDLVMTSAAAIGGRSTVWLAIDGERVAATVAGSDPFTDLAVLLPDEWVDALSVASVALAEPREGQPVALRPAPTGSGDQIDGRWVGTIGRTGEVIKTIMGYDCHTAFVTSMPADSDTPGAAVVNDGGEAIGMVINAQTSLVAALPMSVAVDVARSLIDHGVPSEAWLGIEAVTEVDGRIRLIAIDPEGPAAEALKTDDIVVSVEGERLINSDHLVHLVRNAGSEAELDLVVRREMRYEPVRVRTGTVPTE